MKILNAILRAMNWLTCLVLRCVAWSANRLQQGLQSGPSARLWAATDEELLLELKKRGIQTKAKSKPDLEQSRFVSQEEEAALAVGKLQMVPQTAARRAVELAVTQMRKENRKSPTVQELIVMAIKYA